MPQKGSKNQDLITGRLIYVTDGTDTWPALASTAGVKSGAYTAGRAIIAQREPFIFRPGAAALGSGAVTSGARSGSGTITSGGTADSTYWGSWVTYSPLRGGQIDGAASGGIISGIITFGIKTGASTANAKVTARIANTANTASPTTVVALSAATAASTAETFLTYELPYLLTDTAFNAVPFSIAIGVQSSLAGTTCIARMMESSYILGEMEPAT